MNIMCGVYAIRVHKNDLTLFDINSQEQNSKQKKYLQELKYRKNDSTAKCLFTIIDLSFFLPSNTPCFNGYFNMKC